MIQHESILRTSDNSGARFVKCIKILRGSFHKVGKIGDSIVSSVQEIRTFGKGKARVAKGKIYTGVLVRTKKENSRIDGSFFKFDDNAVILLANSQKPIATRLFGPVTNELRIGKYLKVISLAPYVL